MAAGRSEPVANDTPPHIAAPLGWQLTWFLGRLMLIGAYLFGGFATLLHWPAASAEQAHFDLQPPALWAALTIAVEIGGSLLVLSRHLIWLEAGVLASFTLLAALLASAFWTMEGGERFTATNAFFEHIGLAGGFILVALIAARAPLLAAPA